MRAADPPGGQQIRGEVCPPLAGARRDVGILSDQTCQRRGPPRDGFVDVGERRPQALTCRMVDERIRTREVLVVRTRERRERDTVHAGHQFHLIACPKQLLDERLERRVGRCVERWHGAAHLADASPECVDP
jgi:hypothetical protein